MLLFDNIVSTQSMQNIPLTSLYHIVLHLIVLCALSSLFLPIPILVSLSQ